MRLTLPLLLCVFAASPPGARADFASRVDEATGEWAYREVVERTVHESDGVYALEVGPDDHIAETIEATREHPFWSRGGWTPAGELRPGDEIFTSTGGWIRVHGVHNECIVRHHIFPQQFRSQFQRAGINIDDFTVGIPSGYHTGVVHAGAGPGGDYNRWWREWLAANPGAGREEMAQFAADLFWANFADFGVYLGPFR